MPHIHVVSIQFIKQSEGGAEMAGFITSLIEEQHNIHAQCIVLALTDRFEQFDASFVQDFLER